MFFPFPCLPPLLYYGSHPRLHLFLLLLVTSLIPYSIFSLISSFIAFFSPFINILLLLYCPISSPGGWKRVVSKLGHKNLKICCCLVIPLQFFMKIPLLFLLRLTNIFLSRLINHLYCEVSRDFEWEKNTNANMSGGMLAKFGLDEKLISIPASFATRLWVGSFPLDSLHVCAHIDDTVLSKWRC